MLRVALTGGIGSGKSSAAEIFAALGAVVVDSDEIARKVLDRESVGFGEVVATFGDQILAAGEIDRKKLGQLVFSDSIARKKLEQITHPLIRKEFERIIKTAPENSIVINQIPLLAESKYDYKFDYVIAISAPIEVRKNRLLQRGMKSYEIEQRLAAQANDADRAKISNEVIENSGDLSQLTTNVEKVWRKLLALQSKNK
jgi:dephospho-CoA kinase